MGSHSAGTGSGGARNQAGSTAVEVDSPFPARIGKDVIVFMAGVTSILLGVTVMAGWHIHSQRLIQIFPGLAPMQYNTALGFLLAGAGLITLQLRWDRACALLGLATLSLGSLILFEYAADASLGIDQMFMVHYITEGTSQPGRMAPNAALSFILTGGAFSLYGAGGWKLRRGLLLAIFGSMILAFGAVALYGYIGGFESAYGWGKMTRMAVHTSFGFIALGTGMICAAWIMDVQEGEGIPGWLPAPLTVGSMMAFALLEQALLKVYPWHEEAVIISTLVFASLLGLTVALAQMYRRKAEQALTANRELEESEKWHKALFDNAPDAIFLADPQTGILLDVNEAGIWLLGKKKNEITGNHQSTLHPPRILPEITEIFARHVNGRSGDPVETVVLRGEGTEIPVEISAHLLVRGGKKVAQGIFRDISERKKVESALAASELKYRKLIQNIDAAVVVHAPDTSIITVNEKALELLGLTEDQALGRTSLHPEWRFIGEKGEAIPLEKYPVNQVISSRSPLRDLVLGINRPVPGDLVWVLVNALPVFDDGNIKEIIVTFMDITAQKLISEQLRLAKEEAEEATLTKDRFVSLVAHDLKSPIGAISGLADHILLTSGGALSRENREILGRIVSASHVMVSTINELLDISRLRSGAVRPLPVFFDARDMVAMVFGQAALAAEQKGIRLVNEAPEKFRLFADASLYYEALANLVTNAVKFSSRGDTVRVYIADNSGATMVVEDSGAGMSQERIDSLFEQGEKITTPGTAGETGTGLGLPYAMDIMKAHGGDLRAEPNPGGGSRFFAMLPDVKPLALIADGDPAVRAMIRARLEKQDILVEEAEDGAKAIESLEKLSPHLLLLDISLPVKDGFAVIRTVREEMKNPLTPIIVTTSDAAREVKEKALKTGANDFLTKPLDLEDMSIRVNKLIVRHDFGWR